MYVVVACKLQNMHNTTPGVCATTVTANIMLAIVGLL